VRGPSSSLPETPAARAALGAELRAATGLDEAVLERAIEAVRAARAVVAINISGASMESPRFRARLLERLAAAELRGRLLVELTETAEMQNLDHASETIAGLHALGVPVCMDDFGAGAAAFRYLRALRVQYLKIDGLYVRGAPGGGRERGLVGAMLELARSAEAETIAEMIETEAQAEEMLRLGVSFGQGYLFGRPGSLPGC
jgi:EAL domain-containing protein (putative c-di-GMP-specific phosphodiesterase class I)